MYISFEQYSALYDQLDQKTFNRLAYDAGKHIDRLTTGADGVKKLKVYFPEDEDSVESVKRCAAEIINFLFAIQEAESSAYSVQGYEETENGKHGKVISAITSGSESITFATGEQKTIIDQAVADPVARDRFVSGIIRKYLSGVQDANGVNLLYMGVYPRV